MANSLSPDGLTVNAINGGQVGGNRNLIINGAMQLAQRGTSVTNSSATGYSTVDRWQTNVGNAGTFNISQSTDAPNGFGKSLKFECNTADASLAAGDYLQLKQRIEGNVLQGIAKGTADAKTLSMSFYVKSSKTGTYIFELYDVDNTRQISKSYTISSANTWERKTIFIEADTTGALDDDNDRSMEVNFWLAAGSNFSGGTLSTTWTGVTTANRAAGQLNLADTTGNTWFITGIQLEVGSTATEFEHRSYGDELARCQRYYVDDGFGTNAGGVMSPQRDAQYGHVRAAIVRFPVVMRATPTVSIQSSSADSMDRYGRGQETCYPSAENVYKEGFHNVIKYTSSARTTTTDWTDNGNYINRAGYKADAEL